MIIKVIKIKRREIKIIKTKNKKSQRIIISFQKTTITNEKTTFSFHS